MSEKKLASKQELIDLLKNGNLREKEHKTRTESDVPSFIRKYNITEGTYELNLMVAHWFYIEFSEKPVTIKRFENIMKRYFKKTGSCYLVDLEKCTFSEQDIDKMIKKHMNEMIFKK